MSDLYNWTQVVENFSTTVCRAEWTAAMINLKTNDIRMDGIL